MYEKQFAWPLACGVSGYPVLVSCILVFFDSSGPWGHQDPVSASVAPTSHPRRTHAAPTPHWLAERRCPKMRPRRPKRPSRKPSKNDQVLMLFQHRFLSVLASFWKAKMAPKSNQNRKKSASRAFPFRHRFLYRFLTDFWSQLGPSEPPKSLKFHWFLFVFLIFGVFNLRSIWGPILVPS